MKIVKQAGLTLVEIMVAMGLSALLLTGLYKVVSANQASMALSESVSKVQESLRISFDLLQYDVRMIGYMGCADAENATNNLLVSNEITQKFTEAFEVFHIDSSTTGPSYEELSELLLTDDELELQTGSDILIIRRAVPASMTVSSVLTGADSTEIIGNQNQIDEVDVGHIAFISDCRAMDIFEITNIEELSAEDELGKLKIKHEGLVLDSYSRGAQFSLLVTHIYFVAKDENEKLAFYRYDSFSEQAIKMAPYIKQVLFEEHYDSEGEIAAVELKITGQVCKQQNNCQTEQKLKKLVSIRNASLGGS